MEEAGDDKRFGTEYLVSVKEANNQQALKEPVRKVLGGSLAENHPFRRLAALQQNADALLGRSWRGKDDGTLVRKVVGKAR